MTDESEPTKRKSRARATGTRRGKTDEVSFIEPEVTSETAPESGEQEPPRDTFPPAPEPPRLPASRAARYWEAFITPTVGGVIVALVAALLVGGAITAKVLREQPTYESIAALVIDQPDAITQAGSDGIIAKLNALRLKYIVLLKTSAMTKPVAEKLGVPEAIIAGSVEANAPGPTLVVLVGARTTNQKGSKLIAQAMAEQLVSYVASEEDRAFIQIKDRIEMRIVVPAPDAVQIEPTHKRALTAGGSAGGATLLVVYVLAQLLFVRRRA